MQEFIHKTARDFILETAELAGCQTSWGEPLVGFADAEDPLFLKLKEVVGPDHLLPTDLLAGASTVIAFFMPFEEAAIASNVDGVDASREWARAYLETKRAVFRLIEHLHRQLEDLGHDCAAIPVEFQSDKKRLTSRWSHRHMAYIAGLGTFGLHNMLITRKGCCGAVGSLVTSAKLAPTPRPEQEACLRKRHGVCGRCILRCPDGALRADGFDRATCYRACLRNGVLHAAAGVRDVCGKCLCGVPCSSKSPGERPRPASRPEVPEPAPGLMDRL